MQRIVYGKHPNHEAIDAIVQFLHDNNLHRTAQTLLDESHHDFIAERWEPASLLRGLQLLSDTRKSEQCVEEEDESVLRRDAENLLLCMRNEGVKDRVYRSEDVRGEWKSNVLSVKISTNDECEWAVVGSVDKSLSFVNVNEGKVTKRIEGMVSGAVLSVDFNPVFHHLLAVACMDGTHYLINWQQDTPLVHKVHDHGFKYVLQVKWSGDGTMLATCSSDHSVNVYKLSSLQAAMNTSSVPELERVKNMVFRETPESILWREQCLMVAARGDNFLNLYDSETGQKRDSLNMNTTGDNHVSFTPMYLSSCANTGFVSVSTDKNRTILMAPGCNGPIASYYGAVNDEYSTPRTCFSHNGRTLYSTSQDNTVVAWDLATQKVIHRLDGHCKLIVSLSFSVVIFLIKLKRDIDHHPTQDMLITGSYDKTVKIWGN